MLRAAGPDDVDAVVDLVESAYRGERSRAGWTTEADLIDGRRTDAGLVGDLLADPAVDVLVLEEDGAVVACCELRRPDGPGGTARFGMFAVAPDRQGRGTGSVVLDAARARAAEWGATALELWVIDSRAELIAWYRRRGVLPTGEHRPFPYGDERVGRPRRSDLRFAVLRAPLDPSAP